MATAFQEPTAEGSINLSRLNDAERRVLLLLAEGHTAKSIANTTGSTPTAVNERLREARRKTGVGSSRELARLLKAQENRPEQIGVGRLRTMPISSTQQGAEPLRPRAGVIVMSTILIIGVAVAAVLASQTASAPTNEIDPLIGSPLTSGPDPAVLHARVRREGRDARWALPMETAIQARVMQIPLLGKNGNVLRVTCATDLCEIAGTIGWPGPPPKDFDPKLPQNRAQEALQQDPFRADLVKLGLKSEVTSFTGAKDKPDRLVFLLYYSRADAKPT